ncbi:glutamine synthetase family protein [Microbispora siamensis]
MIFVATCDLAGQTRGRAVPAADHDRVLRTGVGWVPADLAITCFGPIAEDNVFGSTGDLRLLPDASAGIDLPGSDRPGDDTRPGVHLYLADQVLPDGSPWPCCPRTFARTALAELRERTGLEVVASFEHEFLVEGLPASAPFSFQRFRDAEPFGSRLVDAMVHAGLEPETWLPEYGDGQFEVTMRPSEAMVAADRAVLLRELVRDLARGEGRRVTFAPLLDPAGVGNGVHVHLSLRDATTGEPVLYDAALPGRLSETGGRFAAGILRHARAISAVTAASPASFLRLTPHRWSAGGAYLAERNREALLRICPTTTLGDGVAARQFNLEYRAADATANPWLMIGVLVRAGLRGITAGYDQPTVWPESCTEKELSDVPALPGSLREALDDLAGDDVVRSWFADDLLRTYLDVKRTELALVDGLKPDELCRRIADVY